MAGLGEACSHIAAVLFALEANTQVKKSMSCTSLPCTWLPPSFQSVTYAPIAKTDFKQKRKSSDPSLVKEEKMPEPTEEELQTLYRDLAAAGKPALLSLVPGYSDEYVPLSEKGVLPKPLTDLYNADYMDLAHPDLLVKCEEIYSTVTVTSEEASNIENTRGQSSSKLWFQQRAGRVTASQLKAATRTDVKEPSKSLIRSICYPESTPFGSKATTWGCAHEKDARIEYMSVMTGRCFYPRVKAGTLTSAQYTPTLSCTVKSLSARTKSPGKRFCRKPQLSVNSTSDTRPPHPLDTKVTTPWGLIPIKNFTVLWCL